MKWCSNAYAVPGYIAERSSSLTGGCSFQRASVCCTPSRTGHVIGVEPFALGCRAEYAAWWSAACRCFVIRLAALIAQLAAVRASVSVGQVSISEASVAPLDGLMSPGSADDPPDLYTAARKYFLGAFPVEFYECRALPSEGVLREPDPFNIRRVVKVSHQGVAYVCIIRGGVNIPDLYGMSRG